jgi:hypothetical protein
MGGVVNAVQLLADLDRLGILLEAYNDRLRYSPRSALTPDLLNRLKAHKGELLAILRDGAGGTGAKPKAKNCSDDTSGELIDKDDPFGPRRRIEDQVGLGDAKPEPACRCGSTEWRHVLIHDRQSTRRDCARCGKFLRFTRWYGIESVDSSK